MAAHALRSCRCTHSRFLSNPIQPFRATRIPNLWHANSVNTINTQGIPDIVPKHINSWEEPGFIKTCELHWWLHSSKSCGGNQAGVEPHIRQKPQKGGEEMMLDPVHNVQRSEVNSLFSRGTPHLTSPNPWSGLSANRPLATESAPHTPPSSMVPACSTSPRYNYIKL